MPEGLIIALAVLLAVGWLIYKFIEALFKAFNEIQDGIIKTIAMNRSRRFDRKKTRIASSIRIDIPDDLAKAERVVNRLGTEFQSRRNETIWTPLRPTWKKNPFRKQLFSPQSEFHSEMNIAEIEEILCPEVVSWCENESAIFAQDCSYPCSAPTTACSEFHELTWPALQIKEAIIEFAQDSVRAKDLDLYFRNEQSLVNEYNRHRLTILSKYADLTKQIEEWNMEQQKRWKHYIDAEAKFLQEEMVSFKRHSEQYSKSCNDQKENFKAVSQGFQSGARESVLARIGYILGSLTLPASVPRLWKIDFDEEQHILIVEIGLPDVVHRPPVKIIQLKSGLTARPLNQSERREYIPKVHPAILLRVGFEIARSDVLKMVKLLVLNGWVKFRDPTTGFDTTAYTASLMVEPHQLTALNLRNVDPFAAFQNFRGKSAGRLIEIVPIEPALNLERRDSRFVEAKDVLNIIDSSTNLALMDWQDFEHLIRELFEKEFSGRGAEVRACHQINQMAAATRCIAARKLRAVLS